MLVTAEIEYPEGAVGLARKLSTALHMNEPSGVVCMPNLPRSVAIHFARVFRHGCLAAAAEKSATKSPLLLASTIRSNNPSGF